MTCDFIQFDQHSTIQRTLNKNKTKRTTTTTKNSKIYAMAAEDSSNNKKRKERKVFVFWLVDLMGMNHSKQFQEEDGAEFLIHSCIRNNRRQSERKKKSRTRQLWFSFRITKLNDLSHSYFVQWMFAWMNELKLAQITAYTQMDSH